MPSISSISLSRLTLAAAALALHAGVHAHGVSCGDIVLQHPYAPATVGLGKVGAVYFKTIANKGATADRLLAASTPVAARVEIHEMAMAGDVMKMRAVPEVALPAGAEQPWQQGQMSGNHLMLMDLAKPLKPGDKFPITLTFQRAGACQAEVHVAKPKADADAAHAH